MKFGILQTALPVAVMALLWPLLGEASSRRAATPGYVQAKLQYCMDCHGVSGRGYRGFYTMPRLAGQIPEYLENQLRDFAEGRRGSATPMHMARVHGVTPDLRAPLAARLHALNPGPIGGGPRGLVETGRQIYQDGLPDDNVPACAACHGPGGKGDGQNPRLAGQLHSYTVSQLAGWSKNRGRGAAEGDPASIMSAVAKSLTRSQSAAVAAYVSSLK